MKQVLAKKYLLQTKSMCNKYRVVYTALILFMSLPSLFAKYVYYRMDGSESRPVIRKWVSIESTLLIWNHLWSFFRSGCVSGDILQKTMCSITATNITEDEVGFYNLTLENSMGSLTVTFHLQRYGKTPLPSVNYLINANIFSIKNWVMH